MADTSLPNLGELNETPATDDELIIVDKSDSTDGATGTNKKITVNNLSNYQDSKSATLTNKTINSSTNNVEADSLHINVRNESGSTITKGSVVYASGYSVGSEIVLVSLADASSASTMPVLGVAEDDIANNASGLVVANGRLQSFDTSSWSVGDVLYASETAGQLTSTRPTGSAIVQRVAIVLRSNVSTGALEIKIENGSNITGFMATVLDDADATTARATLGAGTSNVSALTDLSDVDTDKSKTPADGDVLTFDGTDWNAETPSAGGGGGNPYGADVVIAASGGDYTTLGAYVTAGPTVGDVVYIQDATTETGSVSLSTANVTLICKNPTAIINMGSNNLTISGANCSARNVYVDIDGEFLWNGAECDIDGLEVTGSSTNQWTFRQTGEEGRVRGLKVINDATGTRTRAAVLLGGSNTAYTNIYASAAVTGASANTGIVSIPAFGASVTNMTLEDNGTLNSNNAAFLDVSGSDCTISGVAVYVNDNTYGFGVNATGTGSALSNVKVYRASSKGFQIGNQVVVSGCSSESFNSTTQHFQITGSDSVVTGCFAQSSGTTGSSNGFIIAGDDNVVTGNRAMSCATGVTISSGNRNVVTSNALNANGTALTDSGTSTLYQTATSSDPLNTV